MKFFSPALMMVIFKILSQYYGYLVFACHHTCAAMQQMSEQLC